MKLVHKVLFIDDLPMGPLQDPAGIIADKNAEMGIETEFHQILVFPRAGESQEDFRRRMSQELEENYSKHESFDLILIDLYMQSSLSDPVKEPVDGPFFVEKIRQEILYTPIVFYSQGKDEEENPIQEQLQVSIRERKIWKVNLITCEKTGLVALLNELMDAIHKNEHRLNIARGSLIGYVSELDDLLCEALDVLWEKLRSRDRKCIELKFRNWMASSMRRKRMSKKNLVAEDHGNFVDIAISGQNFTLKSRVVIIGEILKILGEREMAMEFEILQDGDKSRGLPSLIDIRNSYAHSSKIDKKFQNYKYIRTECRRHLNNIKSILKKHGIRQP